MPRHKPEEPIRKQPSTHRHYEHADRPSCRSGYVGRVYEVTTLGQTMEVYSPDGSVLYAVQFMLEQLGLELPSCTVRTGNLVQTRVIYPPWSARIVG